MTNDILKEAWSSLNHNRRRSALTVLGMAWGIATVVLLLAYGNGFERAVDNIFANFGTRMIAVFGGRTSQQAGGAKAGKEIRLKLEDVDRIANGAPLVKRISPSKSMRARVQRGNRSYELEVIGVYPAFQGVRNLEVANGRFFNEADRNSRARVVVITSDAKQNFFSGQPALGERLRIDGLSFEIVGELTPKMQEGDDNINNQLYIPFNVMNDLTDTEYLGGIWMDYEGTDHEKVEQSVRTVLANHHGFSPNDRRALEVENMMKKVKELHIVTAGLKFLLGFVGSLTLGIGGVGLMNIMLVAVTQRTREIGVQKALGASRRHILLQFLAEAMVITIVGGVLGIVIAYIVSFSAGSLTLYSALAKNAEAADIRLQIDMFTLLASTTILAVVGLLSGMIPAIRASRLDPIEALRYE